MMKFNRQVLSSMLLVSVFVPAVNADVILDPKEVSTLKRLTGVEKNSRNRTGNIAPQPSKDKELNGAVIGKDKELNGVAPSKDKELNGVKATAVVKVKTATASSAKATVKEVAKTDGKSKSK